jgi:membrane protein DedA with SNARE-associated domain
MTSTPQRHLSIGFVAAATTAATLLGVGIGYAVSALHHKRRRHGAPKSITAAAATTSSSSSTPKVAGRTGTLHVLLVRYIITCQTAYCSLSL